MGIKKVYLQVEEPPNVYVCKVTSDFNIIWPIIVDHDKSIKICEHD